MISKHQGTVFAVLLSYGSGSVVMAVVCHYFPPLTGQWIGMSLGFVCLALALWVCRKTLFAPLPKRQPDEPNPDSGSFPLINVNLLPALTEGETPRALRPVPPAELPRGRPPAAPEGPPVTITVGGPPRDATQVRYTQVLRAFTVDGPIRHDPGSEHEGHRGGLRTVLERRDHDRHVVGYYLDGRYWVRVYDGHGHLVDDVTPAGADLATARAVRQDTITDLLERAAAAPGRWLPGYGYAILAAAA
ncbi:hypothetical protein [Pseudonocardia sp. T1-2H]|uniref:hypothetical protein n=1 Tax=Pseudonocardia sp. T1-2H TaxID=3128899 RepID=UPI003100CC84